MFLFFVPAVAKRPVQSALELPFFRLLLLLLRRVRTMITAFGLAAEFLRFALVLVNAGVFPFRAFAGLDSRPSALLNFLLVPNIVRFTLNIPAGTSLRRTLGPVREQFPPGPVLDSFVVAVETDMVSVLQPLDADPAALVEIEHRFRIHLHPIRLLFHPIRLLLHPIRLLPQSALVAPITIPPLALDQTLCLLLIHHRRPPRLVDVFVRELRQLGDVFPDEGAGRVPLLGEGDGGVAAVELGVEGDAGEPLPVAAVAGDLVVEEPLLEDRGPALPVDVAAAAGQETGHGVAAQVVDPAFEAQLAHQGVDPGEAGASVFPALEPGFVQGGADGVGAGDESRGGGDGGG